MSLSLFLQQLVQNPVLALTCLLVLSVVLVNGWTDAPNAIATAVSSGVLSFRRAVRLAAVCNLLGVVCMTTINATVAQTLYSIADFGTDQGAALSALCAALCAIVVWAVLAWRFGVPTSESHALVAGITGSALALPGGLDRIQAPAWGRILLGLFLSLALGYLAGGLCRRVVEHRALSPKACRRGLAVGAGVMAFLHGAQDGQKFLGVFLLGTTLAQGSSEGGACSVPLWLMLLCACVMALGTALGGRRIVETVGHDMVCLSPRSGLAADLGGGLCLLLCTLAGLPVSTTHAKTAAILGAGASGGGRVDARVVRRIWLTWLFTFPCCGILGFFLARLFRFSP